MILLRNVSVIELFGLEKCEDTKGVSKDRKCNDKKKDKKTNNDVQSTTQKTKN
jgi:hypothetical protein